MSNLLTQVLLLNCLSLFANAIELQKNDPQTWLRSGVKEFGCFLQKEFSFKDKRFNCDLKKYQNSGDPCKNSEQYYEGPQFPSEKSNIVNKSYTSIELSWEHGDLQSVSITLDKKYTEVEAKKKFKLTDTASIQDCTDKLSCVVLTGFDHMGGGDVDCGG